MWHNYHLVKTLDEALGLLARHGASARIIAGGTDIILELERGVRPGIDTLIDITRVPGLDEITLTDHGFIHLGPLVTHNHCAGSDLIRERAWPLAQACWEIGAPQIRNRGTVAGNLITASPANDTITPLMALDASVVLRSVRGERSIPLSAFYTGVRRTVMAPDEILTGITFPALDANARGMFIKLGLRKFQAIAVVNVAVIVGAGDARIALGSVAPTIVRAAEAERYLQDRSLDEHTIETAARLASQVATPIDDIRGTAEYRREVTYVITRRALEAIHAGEVQGWVPPDPVMLWGSEAGRAPALNGQSQHFVTDADTAPIITTVNGVTHTIHAGHDKTLLRLLREDVGLIGTKEGCAEGECGACTVFLDGAAVMSCLVPAPRAHGSTIVTVEGLAQDGDLHPIQDAFIQHGAVQCGYCTPGLLMSGAKLLEERENPTRWEAQQAIAGNLCRCTGYYKILEAIEQAGQHTAATSGD